MTQVVVDGRSMGLAYPEPEMVAFRNERARSGPIFARTAHGAIIPIEPELGSTPWTPARQVGSEVSEAIAAGYVYSWAKVIIRARGFDGAIGPFRRQVAIKIVGNSDMCISRELRCQQHCRHRQQAQYEESQISHRRPLPLDVLPFAVAQLYPP